MWVYLQRRPLVTSCYRIPAPVHVLAVAALNALCHEKFFLRARARPREGADRQHAVLLLERHVGCGLGVPVRVNGRLALHRIIRHLRLIIRYY